MCLACAPFPEEKDRTFVREQRANIAVDEVADLRNRVQASTQVGDAPPESLLSLGTRLVLLLVA